MWGGEEHGEVHGWHGEAHGCHGKARGGAQRGAWRGTARFMGGMAMRIGMRDTDESRGGARRGTWVARQGAWVAWRGATSPLNN